MNFKYLVIVCFTILVSGTFAEKIVIDFESDSNSLAVVGADATNLYQELGVTFPSHPKIARGLLGRGQELQQIPAGRDFSACESLIIRFDGELSVNEVTMKVTSNHSRSYVIEAFSEGFPEKIKVDEHLHVAPGFEGQGGAGNIPPLNSQVELSAGDSKGIIEVIVHPPVSGIRDCFGPAAIDDLTFEIEESNLAYTVEILEDGSFLIICANGVEINLTDGSLGDVAGLCHEPE